MSDQKKSRYSRKMQVTIGKETKTISEWAKVNQIPVELIMSRLCAPAPWELVKAITTKPITRSAAGRKGAARARYLLPSVGKDSPEFVPGRRRPRADRPVPRRVDS